MLIPPDQTVHSDLIGRIRADMSQPILARPRRINLAVEQSFMLGRARIHPDAHEYRIGSKPTRMQPRPLKVLVALQHRRGRVVSRDELIDRCWEGRIVGNDVINRCVSLLRLLAMQTGGFRIETISGAGYRLVELAPRTQLELRPRPWMIAASALAGTAALSGMVVVDRARLSPIATHICGPSLARRSAVSTAQIGEYDARPLRNRQEIGRDRREIGP